MNEDRPTLFITNRFFRQSIRSRVGRRVDFDLANNAPSNSVYYCRREAQGVYTEIGSRAFMETVKGCRQRQVVLLIHGFSNLPEPDIFPRVAGLQRLFDEQDPDLALVIPLIWPCDNDLGIVKDYWDDQKSADSSGYAFARVLQKFLRWRDEQGPADTCLKRINVLAHSMGNRVLRETLRIWDRYDLAAGVPLLFRNAFLLAADIVNESLEPGRTGVLICHASRNVLVYYASDDLALRASKVSNLRNGIASRRLGHTGPEDLRRTPGNVYAVDCDEVNMRYDPIKGHTYFLQDERGGPGRVFEHICATMRTGRVFPGEEGRRTAILRD